MAKAQSQLQVIPDQVPVFYNVILEERSGDKYLIAQTTDPRGFIDMQYPKAVLDSEFDDELSFTCGEDEPQIWAIAVRPMMFRTLLNEVDFSNMRRQ